jgi:hypothetical protein
MHEFGVRSVFHLFCLRLWPDTSETMSIFTSLFGQKRATEKQSRSFPTRSQIEDYVGAELKRGISSGWRIVRNDRTRLWWTLERVSIPQGEWPTQDFSLLVSDDLQWFILTHGNCDVGCGGLGHALLDAMVISASSLRLPSVGIDASVGSLRFQLSDCIRFVIEHRKPNEWGYT